MKRRRAWPTEPTPPKRIETRAQAMRRVACTMRMRRLLAQLPVLSK